MDGPYNHIGLQTPELPRHIARRPASVILHSNRVADKIGRPLTTEVLIRFWRSESPAEKMSKTFETSIRGRRFAYWSRPIRNGRRDDHNGPPTYVWVAEGGWDHPHIHWCLHIGDGKMDGFMMNLRKCVASVPELAALPPEELVSVRDVWDFNRYTVEHGTSAGSRIKARSSASDAA